MMIQRLFPGPNELPIDEATRRALKRELSAELRQRAPAIIKGVRHETKVAIKIGVSEMPNRRLTEMQVVVPERLRLLMAFNGDRATEKLLHQAFAPDCIRGEWYRPSKASHEFMRIMMLDAPKYPDG